MIIINWLFSSACFSAKNHITLDYFYGTTFSLTTDTSRGSFYNVIVPIHIPEDDVAALYVGEDNNENWGTVNLQPDVGILVGGESLHGTAKCDYREAKDFRLSFAIYMADVNDDNVDLVASDSTSLWPSIGDSSFIASQRERLWTRDGTASLVNDKGRKPFNVQDEDSDCARSKHLCDTDLLGKRLRCPKTCNLYMEDEVYYAKLKAEGSLLSSPTCSSEKRD